MTRETRIGLLVGLMFIVLFGLVLSELTGDASMPAKPTVAEANKLVKRLSIEGLPQVDLNYIDYVEGLPVADAEKPAEQLAVKDSDKSPTKASADAKPTVLSASIFLAEKPIKPATPIRMHVVRSGESLCKIAERYYGSQGQYMRIFQANKDKLPDATTVIVGQKLVIPSLPEKLTAPHGSGVSAVKDVAARGAKDGASRQRISSGFEGLTIKQLQRSSQHQRQ